MKKDPPTHTYQKLNIVSMGGKGGTGKTTFMVSLVDWFRDRDIPIVLKDLDLENASKGGLKNYYPDAVKVDAHSRGGLDVFFDVMDNPEPVVVADMGAGQGQAAMRWFTDAFESATDLGIGFLFVGVVTNDPASVASVLEWGNALQDKVKYLIVLNEMAEPHSSFKYWHESDKASEFCQAFHPAVLTLASRTPDLQGYLADHGLTLREVAERRTGIEVLGHTRHIANAQRYRRKLFEDLDRLISPLLPNI